MKRATICLFGLCLLLASCSQEDTLNNVNKDGAMRQVSLNVNLPGGMTTRAGAEKSDPAVTRCYVQVLDKDGNQLPENFSTVRKMLQNGDGNSFSLTVTLNPDEEYDFLFWADNADANDPTSLTDVAYTTDGKTIAFAGKLENQGYSQDGINAQLTHVVTRISVESTGNVTIDGNHLLTISVPECYTAYDVSTMQPKGETTGFSYSGFNGIFSAGDHVGHFYVLGDEEKTASSTVTLQYSGVLKNPLVELTNVPLKPNYDITLKGDIAHSGLVDGDITATVQTDWNSTGVEKEF